jgi:predicted enzyme related to lactoylglutathione lyase
MPTMTSHAPGTFCWIELGSTDAEGAKRFYPALFGWTMRDVPIPGGVYIMCQLDGHEVAAMYQMSDAEKAQGIPSHWFNYIAVANADETAARVPALGGTVLAPPFDVMEHGRMAVLQDPTGGVFGVWQAMRHAGVGVRDEPGSLCWNEMMSPDRATAAAFYGRLIGWEQSSMEMPDGEYTVFIAEGTPKAGCAQITPAMEGAQAGWLTYFATADCDATAQQATALGGQVLMGPENAPGIGRWAMLRDPQGAVFSVIAPIA